MTATEVDHGDPIHITLTVTRDGWQRIDCERIRTVSVALQSASGFAEHTAVYVKQPGQHFYRSAERFWGIE